MKKNPYPRKVFTAEAILVGCLFSLVIGLIVGLAAGLMTNSYGVGVFVGVILFFFSVDMIFRGSDVRS